MDQLKTILVVLKKYHFWALCSIVLITTLVCWWTATSGLAGLYQQNKATIESKFSAFTALGTDPPNENVINKKVEQEAVLQQNVFRAWEVLYEQQKKLSVAPPELGEEFKSRFEKLKPNEDLDLNSRQVYQNFIKRHLPTFVSLVDARRPAPPGTEPAPAAPTNPDMSSNEQQFIGVVDWNDGDYKKIVSRFEWQETPSTAEILLAQEDLWVYEALLRVVKNTNKDATNPSNAVVKSIETMSIGKDAVGKAAEETVVRIAVKEVGPGGPGAPPVAPPIAPPGAGRPPAAGAPGNESGATASAQEAALATILEGRYVDSKGMPLPAGSSSGEFKMMPIYLSLVVDQRQVPKLLVECANCTMPIEVSRIQLKAGDTQVLDVGSMSGVGVGSVPKGGMAPGGRARTPSPSTSHSGPSAPGHMGPRADVDTTSPVGQYDIPVDLVGVIYIYNPPDRQRLGMPAQSAEPAAPGSSTPAVPATPAATPPAAALIAPPSNPKRTGT